MRIDYVALVGRCLFTVSPDIHITLTDDGGTKFRFFSPFLCVVISQTKVGVSLSLSLSLFLPHPTFRSLQLVGVYAKYLLAIHCLSFSCFPRDTFLLLFFSNQLGG